MSSDQPSDQRTYGIGAAARIEVTWGIDAYCLISTPVRMTGHNTVNQLGPQVVQCPRHSPWVGTRNVMVVMLQLSCEELAVLRNVAPAFIEPGMAVPSDAVAMGRAGDPTGRGQAAGKGHGEGPCWRTAGLPASPGAPLPLAVASSHCDACRQLGMGSPRGSLAFRDWVDGPGDLARPFYGKWWQPAGASPGCAGVVPAVLSHSAGPRQLRAVGARLIIVGHHIAQARPQPGKLWRAWRAPQSLRMPLAIGRVSLTQCQAPYALGVALPFWLAERIHWRWVVLLLRRSDALRVCCAPWHLRLPVIGAAVQAALARLERTVSALTTTAR
jgi:hypothetical protein